MGKVASLEDAHEAEWEAMANDLGPVGLVQFLQSFEADSGDDSSDRQAWLDGEDFASLNRAARRTPDPHGLSRPECPQ